MYLIHCPGCRTALSDEATLCPSCGQLLFYAKSPPSFGERHAPPVIEHGRSNWTPRC